MHLFDKTFLCFQVCCCYVELLKPDVFQEQEQTHQWVCLACLESGVKLHIYLSSWIWCVWTVACLIVVSDFCSGIRGSRKWSGFDVLLLIQVSMNLIIFALKLLQDYMINWRFKSLYCARNLEFNIDINRKLRFGLVWKEEVNDHED